MLGLGLSVGAAQTPPLARYNIGGKTPAVVADFPAGVYGINGAPLAFDGLFSFARLSAAWKLDALGNWVEVASGEPRTGHHIVKDGKLVPAGIAMSSEVRTNLWPNSHSLSSSSAISGGTGSAPIYNVLPQNSNFILPDGATGADPGVGFTCTGLVSDGVGGWWVGNLGRPNAASMEPAAPQLVRLNSSGDSILETIPVSFQMQGVARKGDTLFYVRPGTGVYQIKTDGTGEALLFSQAGGNGLAYDPIRERLWVSISDSIASYTLDGTLDEVVDLGISYIDQLYYDAERDLFWVSSGASGALGTVSVSRPDGTALKSFSVEDGYAIEGLAVEGNEIISVYDGYFHADDGVPAEFEFNTIRRHKVKFGPSNIPADYLQLDKGAGGTLSDFSVLQLATLTEDLGRYAFSVYAFSEGGASSDVAMRIVQDGSSTSGVSGDEWSRIDYSTTADQTELTCQILLRGTLGTSDEAVLWLDIVQIESGQFPTAAIPTEGAPVSVAAESLQIDAPVLARAIGSPGPELVDTTWINDDPNTLVADGDQLTLTRQIGASEGVATSNTETLTANETYLLSIPILSVTNNFPVGVYHGTTQIAQSDEAGTLEVFYTPDTTTTNTFTLRLRGSNAVQSSAVIKQPSLRKVTMPAAISIVIEGYMTYEDEGIYNTAQFMLWRKDADNYINMSLDTYDAETGEVNSKSEVGTVFSNSRSSQTEYSPGANVPFSIAMSLSPTELNSAAGGNLGGVVSVTGFADLLTAAFELAKEGNMSITRLLIFADDIGDAGLVGATE